MPYNAYEGVERPENFTDQAAIDLYRAAALDKSRVQAEFIARHFPVARTVLETCCGNGRLLIFLADKMDRGYGFDLAESRIAFGNRWIVDRAIANTDIWCDDALTPSSRLSGLRVQLGICITGTFGYFEPLQDGAGQRVINCFADHIEPQGGLLLELLQHPREAAMCRLDPNCRYRSWIELPESDPFRYYLSEYILDEDRHILEHNKTFISRTGAVDTGRSEALRLYSRDEVTAVLAPWFENLSYFADWSGAPYTDDSETLIVTAKRKP